jgi:hypothetical protein
MKKNSALKYLLSVGFIWVISITLPSCKSVNINSAAPDKELSTTPKIPQVVSVINVPVSIPVSQLQNRINQEVNGVIYKDDQFRNYIKMTITKTGTITVTGDNNLLNFSIPLHINVQGQYQPCTICPTLNRSADFDLVIKTSSSISISPTWQIQTKTSGDYDWGQQKPSLSIGPVNIPLSSVIDLALKPQMDKIFARFDQEIQNRVTIKDYVQKAWVAAQQPFLIDKTYNTWLIINPTGLSATALQAKAGQISMNIGIKCFISTVSGDVPHPIVNNTLPNLDAYSSPDNGFSVALNGEISYAFASQLLRSQVQGQTYQLDDNKYSMKVDSISLSGNADYILIRLDLEGKQLTGNQKIIKGTVYMQGVPYYDPQDMSIKVKDLDYNVKTKNVLIKSAGWLLKAGLQNEIKKHLVFSLKDKLEDTKQALQKSISNNTRINENAYFKGTINSIDPQAIYLTPFSMVATVNAKGSITIVVDKL